MDPFWEDLWRREEEFMRSAKPDLRHGESFVGVATLSGQFYCEYKVENEYAFGEVLTEAKEKGTELHDELIPAEEVTAGEFVKTVSRKVPSFAVLRVWGTVGGLRMVGMPDHIVWSQGRPLWLVELKTTRGDPKPLWEDQMVQARIYGLLLDEMGFDCSTLKLAVVRVKSEGLSDEERKEWAAKVSRALMEGKTGELESRYGGSMKVHLLSHDRHAAEASVATKRGYWTGEREPESSTSVGKCRACEYRSSCPRSLVKEDAGGGQRATGGVVRRPAPEAGAFRSPSSL